MKKKSIMCNGDEKMKKKSIMFNGEYFNIIYESIKTSTIRKHCHFKKEEIIEARFNGPGFECISILLKVTNISIIAFRDIDNDIAMSEGFMHADLLKKELNRIYHVDDNSELFYQIEFERGDFD